MDNSEKNTIRLIRQGDKGVFKILFEIYYQKLYLYAKSYVGDADTAKDIVQDLFITLWEKKKNMVIVSSLSSYFFRAIHNKCIQFLRHKKVIFKFREKHMLKLKEAEILYNTSVDFTFSEVQFNEILNILNRTYNSLSGKTREVFRLSRIEARRNQDIADTLNINIKTVEYYITKALKIFHRSLKDYFMLFVLFLCTC
ncbi:MAG: RNA polymerase sigma-70 factor [Bacteroidales bacterium]|nr:MAG: RNA polymerase sigma-70 factor [Bacteroidales bacterium]